MKGQVRNGERKPASEWHSPTAAHGRRNKSVHQREASELGSLTSYRARKISRDSKRKPESEGHSRPVERTRRDKSGQLTRTSTRDTHSLWSAERVASQSKGRQRATGTHVLSGAEEAKSQHSERRPVSDGYSLSVE